MNTTSFEFRAKCIALSLACLLHAFLLMLLYFFYTHRHQVTTQSMRTTSLRVSLKQPPQISVLKSLLSKPVLPVNTPEPEPMSTEPTQSIENSSLPLMHELPEQQEQESAPDPQQDMIKSTASLDQGDAPDTQNYGAQATAFTTADVNTLNKQDIQSTPGTLETTGPTHTQITQGEYAPNTLAHPLYDRYTSSPTIQQNLAPSRPLRRKKRYVNKRHLAAAQTPAAKELMQACHTALRSITQRTDTRTQDIQRDYKSLEKQAAQAGISVEHMTHVQDKLAHMKYAHYESKAQQLLRQTCNIHTIQVTVAKPILEYIDIFITVDKQGNVLRVKFCTPLPLDIEQAITQLIKLCQFPPIPDHFQSPEHTFGLRALVDFQEGGGRLVCR